MRHGIEPDIEPDIEPNIEPDIRYGLVRRLLDPKTNKPLEDVTPVYVVYMRGNFIYSPHKEQAKLFKDKGTADWLGQLLDAIYEFRRTENLTVDDCVGKHYSVPEYELKGNY